MPVKTPTLTGMILLAGCLAMLTPETARARHEAVSAHHGKTAHVSRNALAAARRKKAALVKRRAAQSAVIAARKKTRDEAAKDAAASAQKARHFSALTEQAESELSSTEAQIALLTEDIAALTARQKAQAEALARGRARLQALLPVAVRLSRYPGTSFISLSGQASEAVQGLSIIAGLARATARQTRDLAAQQVLLDKTAQTLAERNEALQAARSKLATLRDRNARLSREATRAQEEAQARASAAQKEIASATEKAGNLEEAIAAIEKTQADIQARLAQQAEALARRHQAEKAKDVSRQAESLGAGDGVSRGGGQGPVSGTVLTGWHQHTESGPATGITYTAHASAIVRAPCAGQIDFAGPFRSFGNMIILDCGHHYRFVLAGFGKLSASSGQHVGRKAVLGAMSAEGGHLFVQLRAGSKAVDPRPYL